MGGTDDFNVPNHALGQRSDMELVAHIRAAYGAGQAYAAERGQQVLYERHYKRINKLLVRKLPTRDIADEKTHVVFEKVLISLVEGKPIGEFSPWLFGVAKNVIRDYYRSKDYDELNARRASGDGPTDTDHGKKGTVAEPSHVGDFGEWETLDIVEQLLRSYKSSHRRIVELYVLQGYSAAETAELTGESVDNVYKVAQRFRDELRRLLAGEDFDASDDPETGL